MGNLEAISSRAQAYCKMKGYADDAVRSAAYQAFVSGAQETNYLLESLEMIVAWVEKNKLDTAEYMPPLVVSMARAAIAKAKLT